MISQNKKTLKSFGGIAFMTGLTLVTSGVAGGGLFFELLNTISGHLLTSFIEKSSFDKIQRLVKRSHPSELNHDLKKLIVESIDCAIQNIEILYREKLTSKDQKRQLKSFTKELRAEVEILSDALSEDSPVTLRKMVETSDSATILQSFDLKTEDFPIINSETPYTAFFREQFQPNLKLCFGELLKDEDNRSALIAYQREIFQSLENGIDKVIQQNNEILEKLENKGPIQKENHRLNKVRDELKNKSSNTPDPIFLQSLNDQLDQISKILVEQNEEILDELGKVKGITKGFSRDLKRNWLQKNKAWVMSGFGLAIITISALTYHINTQPFDMVIHLKPSKSVEVHPDYPELGASSRLRVYLPNENKEKELTYDNEVVMANLHASLKGFSGKAELLDRYWELSRDSINFLPGNKTIHIKPNDALAYITGRILSRNGENRIPDARVFVNDHSTLTDSLGHFSLKMPFQDRKRNYVVRVEKEGYSAAEKIYYPGSDIEIRLNKKN